MDEWRYIEKDLFEIHRLHSLIHALDDVGHAARDLPHRDGRLDPTADGVDARREPQQIQSFVLLPDRVLRVDLGDVGVVLLDGLDISQLPVTPVQHQSLNLNHILIYCHYERRKEFENAKREREERRLRGTFFSLFFSAVSSFPAFAACRFSCLAVN